VKRRIESERESPPLPDRIGRPAAALFLGAVAGGTIAYALAMMVLMIRMPAQIDVWEGKLLCEAYRWAQTGSFYDDPVEHGATSLYTPLYQLVLGAVAGSRSPSFASGRLLSFAATLATGLMVLGACGLLRRSGGVGPALVTPSGGVRSLCVLVVLGMFLSCAWNSQWYAVMVKSDALCHAIWMAGLLLAVRRGRAAICGSALLVALAFFAKQTALFVAPGIALFLFLDNRRSGALWVLTYAVSLILGWLVFLRLAGDWMWFYTFGRAAVQAGRNLFTTALWRALFAAREVPLLLAGLLAGLACFPRLRRERVYLAALCILPWAFAGGVWTTAAPGGGTNSLMPLLYLMVVLSGYAFIFLLGTVSALSPGVMATAGLLLLLQFDLQAPYRVSKSLGRFDRDFTEVLEFLDDKPGAVYAPVHNVFSLFLDRPVYDDLVLAREIMWHWTDKLPETRIRRRVNSGEYRWLIMDKANRDEALFTEEGARMYERARDTESWTIYERTDSSGTNERDEE